LQPGELKEYISKHCRESGKEDADALLSEAAGLESKGDTAGALAKYEAVRQRFRGTEAARDAEASIRSLKGKVG
jgi:TolA-binding protein